ncbi:MAG: ABC transporter substrate-binding protein [Actinomycetota bacterium]|nr:ABC transporter substrate-binding protein [Actinomycetota bacterium]
MSTRRWWLILMAALLVGTACAGGDVGDDEEAEEEGDGGSIEVAAVWTGVEQKNFEAVLDAFSEESGVDTSYTSTGDDVATFLGTKIEGGSPPDVAVIPQPGLVRDFAEKGDLHPLGDEAIANVEENYEPIWKDLGTFDGEVSAVYFKAANKSTWWYNTAVFEQAGVEPPETWDEMLQTAKTVNASGVAWLSIGGGDAWPLTDLFENIYVQTAGPEKYDQLAEHEIPWTDESVIEALETMAELLGEEANLAGGIDGILKTDFTTSVTQTFTDPPEAATVFEGDFTAGVITGETGAQPGDYDFFLFPQVGGGEPAMVGGADAAVALTDDPDAQALLAFLATPEASEIWAEAGGFTSPNKNVDLSVYPDELTQRSAEALVGAETFRFDLSDLQPAEFGATPGRGMWLRMQEFVKNPDDPEAAAKAMEQDASKAFK